MTTVCVTDPRCHAQKAAHDAACHSLALPRSARARCPADAASRRALSAAAPLPAAAPPTPPRQTAAPPPRAGTRQASTAVPKHESEVLTCKLFASKRGALTSTVTAYTKLATNADSYTLDGAVRTPRFIHLQHHHAQTSEGICGASEGQITPPSAPASAASSCWHRGRSRMLP